MFANNAQKVYFLLDQRLNIADLKQEDEVKKRGGQAIEIHPASIPFE